MQNWSLREEKSVDVVKVLQELLLNYINISASSWINHLWEKHFFLEIFPRLIFDVYIAEMNTKEVKT